MTETKSLSAELYAFITKSLGLPNLPETGKRGTKLRSQYWNVLGKPVDNLVLVHYISESIPLILADTGFTDAEKRALLSLRGVVVDQTTGKVACRSFGYTPTVTVGGEEPLPTDGKNLTLTDQYGIKHVVDMKLAKFQVGYEGTIARRYRRNGKCYLSTHRKIDATESHWGQSDSFYSLYYGLGGPEDEVLFDLTKPHSNFCHIFMIVHPDLQIATKMNVGQGYVVYLNSIELSVNDGATDTEWESNWIKTAALGQAPTEDDDGKEIIPVPPPTAAPFINPAVLASATFGVSLANRILVNGFSEMEVFTVDPTGKETTTPPEVIQQRVKTLSQLDIRLRPGESVICTHPGGTLKIASVGYHWRVAIGNNNPNRYYQFAFLTNYAFPDPDLERKRRGIPGIFDGTERDGEYSYHQLFPFVGCPTDEEFAAIATDMGEEPMYLPPKLSSTVKAQDLNYDSKNKNLRDLRLRNIAMCYILAMAYSWQSEVCNYYARFTEDRKNLLTFLTTNMVELRKLIRNGTLVTIKPWGDGKKLDRAGASIQRLIETAYENVGSRRESGTDFSRAGKKMAPAEIVKDNLRNLISKEYGESIYRLCRALERQRKEQDRLKEQERIKSEEALPTEVTVAEPTAAAVVAATTSV